MINGKQEGEKAASDMIAMKEKNLESIVKRLSNGGFKITFFEIGDEVELRAEN